jgi:hypothetical protein
MSNLQGVELAIVAKLYDLSHMEDALTVSNVAMDIHQSIQQITCEFDVQPCQFCATVVAATVSALPHCGNDSVCLPSPSDILAHP